MAYLTDPDRDSSMSEVRTPNVKLLLFLLCLQLLSIAALTGGPPRINSNYPKELWVPAGEIVRLSCPVASDSEETRPMITWQKDQDAIGVGWERFKMKSELLLIKDAEISDSGIYVCTATNGFGTVSAEHKVCVFGKHIQLIQIVRYISRHRFGSLFYWEPFYENRGSYAIIVLFPAKLSNFFVFVDCYITFQLYISIIYLTTFFTWSRASSILFFCATHCTSLQSISLSNEIKFIFSWHMAKLFSTFDIIMAKPGPFTISATNQFFAICYWKCPLVI